jgi:hypothetical protein
VLPVAENFTMNSIPQLRASADEGKQVATEISAELITKFQQGINPFRPVHHIDGTNGDSKTDMTKSSSSLVSSSSSAAAAIAAAATAAPAEELADPPVLTNTSLTIAKFMGKYIAIMRDLRMLASEGFKGYWIASCHCHMPVSCDPPHLTCCCLDYKSYLTYIYMWYLPYLVFNQLVSLPMISLCILYYLV